MNNNTSPEEEDKNQRQQLQQDMLQSLIKLNMKNSCKFNLGEEEDEQVNINNNDLDQIKEVGEDNLWQQKVDQNQQSKSLSHNLTQSKTSLFKNNKNEIIQQSTTETKPISNTYNQNDMQQIYICSTEQSSPINQQKGNNNKLRMSLMKSFQSNTMSNGYRINLRESEYEMHQAVQDIRKILKKIKSYKEFSQNIQNQSNQDLYDQNQIFQQFQQNITLSTQEDHAGSNSFKQMSIISQLFMDNEDNKDNEQNQLMYSQDDQIIQQPSSEDRSPENEVQQQQQSTNNIEKYENPFTYRVEKTDYGINISMQNNASKVEDQIEFDRFIQIYTCKQKIHQFIEIVSVSKKYDPTDQSPIFFVYDNMTANYYEMKINQFEDEDDEEFSHNFHLSFTQTFQVDENEKEIVIECFINKHLNCNKNYLILMKQLMQINQLEEETNEDQKIKDYIKIAEAYQKLFNTSVAVQYYHRIIDYYRRNSICNDIQIQALINIVNLYDEQNDFISALKAGNCAILFAQTQKENILIVMKTCMAVGNVYLKQQSYSEAIQLFERIIDLSNDFFEKNNIKNNLSSIKVSDLIVNGGETPEQLNEKQKLVKQLQKRCESIEQEEIVAVIYQKLAQIYEETNMYQQSQDMLLESVVAIKSIINTLDLYKLYMQNKQKSPQSPIIQKQGYSILRNSSFKFIYQKKDQIDKGIRKNKLDLANIYQQLASKYLQSQEEFESALEYYMRAKMIYEEMYHSLHWIVAESLNNIALVYLHMLEFEKAVQNFKKALQIKKMVYHANHYSIALSCTHLGCAFAKFARYEEALQYYQKALIIYQQKSQDRYIDLGETYNNIANVYSSIGNFNNALQYYEKAERIFQKVINQDDITFGQLYENIGIALISMSQYYQAYQYLKKSEQIYMTLFGQEHPLSTRIRIWNQKAIDNMNEFEISKIKQHSIQI